jgi:hypothetical protein
MSEFLIGMGIAGWVVNVFLLMEANYWRKSANTWRDLSSEWEALWNKSNDMNKRLLRTTEQALEITKP